MRDLYNLVVDLDDRFVSSGKDCSLPGLEIGPPAAADDRMLAWIDEEFGGSWSSEAHAGTNVVATRNGAPVGFAAFDPQGLHFAWLRGVARERDVGVFGPFGVAAAERKTPLARSLLELALAALRERGYRRALIPAVGEERLVRYYADAVQARIAERFAGAALAARRPRTLVMASGNGSNLQAVLDAACDGSLPIDVVSLVTNHSQAHAIERARNAAVASIRVLPWKKQDEPRGDYDARLLDVVASEKPELVLLLGWMHLLAEPFVRAFPEMLNLHPAFLPLDPERDEVGLPDGTRIPAFRGPHAVRDALAAGSRWAGATVHRVTPATDRGPVLVRKPLYIEAGEAEASVMARLHPLEHHLVVAGITRWLYERE